MKKATIIWLDSNAWSGGWMSMESAYAKINGIQPVKSIGYILKEDNDYIFIVQNQNGKMVSHLYAIPKKSIIEIS